MAQTTQFVEVGWRVLSMPAKRRSTKIITKTRQQRFPLLAVGNAHVSYTTNANGQWQTDAQG